MSAFILVGTLMFLFFINVLHLTPDMGRVTDPVAWLFAMGFMLAISSGWAYCVSHAVNGKTWLVKGTAIALMPLVFIFGDLLSVSASTRAFAKKKHELVQHELMGPAGVGRWNNLVASNKNLSSLVANGITSGEQYNSALAAQQRATREYELHKNDEVDSASAKALKAGNEDRNIDDIVADNSSRKAWSLEVLFNILSILNAMRYLQGRTLNDIMTETAPPKKQHGSEVSP